MHAPLISTITLLTEVIISTIIYFTLYQGYTQGKFPTKLAFFALIYETLFNITYMFSRVPGHTKVAKIEAPYVVGLAIIHGILSLIMFVALVIFFIAAWRNYKKEVNYFKAHKILTWTFLFFWTFSIVSGILFYFVEYVI
jgi:hypothetical protein